MTEIAESRMAEIMSGETWATTDELAVTQWHMGLPWETPILSGAGRHVILGDDWGCTELGDGVTVMGDVLACDGEAAALREAYCPLGWEPCMWLGICDPGETWIAPRDLAWLADATDGTVWAIVPVCSIPPTDDQDAEADIIGWAIVTQPMGAWDVIGLAEAGGDDCEALCPVCSAAMAGLGAPTPGWVRPEGVWGPLVSAGEPAPEGVHCPACSAATTGYLTLWQRVM